MIYVGVHEQAHDVFVREVIITALHGFRTHSRLARWVLVTVDAILDGLKADTIPPAQPGSASRGRMPHLDFQHAWRPARSRGGGPDPARITRTSNCCAS